MIWFVLIGFGAALISLGMVLRNLSREWYLRYERHIKSPSFIEREALGLDHYWRIIRQSVIIEMIGNVIVACGIISLVITVSYLIYLNPV